MRNLQGLGLTRPAARGIDWGHPLARGLTAAFLFDEGGQVPYNLASTFQHESERFGIPTGATLPTLGVGPFGACGIAANTASHWVCGHDEQYGLTDQCTIQYIRRKTDTTNRACGHFGLVTDSGNYRMGAHVPYSDGTVYWDFGIGGATQRLSVAGLPQAGLQKWGFVAGRRGMSIWLDGVRRANNTTAVSRSISTSTWAINYGNNEITGDLLEVYFVAILQAEWGAQEFEEWNDNPYAFLSMPGRRSSDMVLSTILFRRSTEVVNRVGSRRVQL